MSCSQLTKKKQPCKNKGKYDGLCYKHRNKNKEDISKQDISKEDISKEEDKFKEETCIVCTDIFSNEFKPLQPCGHYIHIECVCNSGKPICPVCRTDVVMTKQQMDKTNRIYQEHKVQEEKEHFDMLVQQENILNEMILNNLILLRIDHYIRRRFPGHTSTDLNIQKRRFLSIFTNLFESNHHLIDTMHIDEYIDFVFVLACSSFIYYT